MVPLQKHPFYREGATPALAGGASENAKEV